MKEFKANLKILKVERRNNSYYGNPSYQLITETEDGKVLIGKTATNAVLGYEVSWTWEGDWKDSRLSFYEERKLHFRQINNLGGKIIWQNLLATRKLSLRPSSPK